MARKSHSPEAAFRKAMRLSYPNHPEMFTLLHYEEWKPGIWKVTLLDQDLNPGDRVAAMLHASGKLWVGGYSEPAPAWAMKNPRSTDHAAEFSRGWEDGEQAFDLSMSPDAPEILTQAQLRRSHSEAYSRGYLGAVREGEGDLDEYIELEGSEPSPNPRRRSRRNPFWVTPKGTAVHHTDAQWAGYTDKHPDRVLPRQAERQVRAEGPKKRVAKGWKIKPKEVDGSTRYLIFYKSKNSGKYAMDRNKAAMMTHLLDPRTFRRKTSKS